MAESEVEGRVEELERYRPRSIVDRLFADLEELNDSMREMLDKMDAMLSLLQSLATGAPPPTAVAPAPPTAPPEVVVKEISNLVSIIHESITVEKELVKEAREILSRLNQLFTTIQEVRNLVGAIHESIGAEKELVRETRETLTKLNQLLTIIQEVYVVRPPQAPAAGEARERVYERIITEVFPPPEVVARVEIPEAVIRHLLFTAPAPVRLVDSFKLEARRGVREHRDLPLEGDLLLIASTPESALISDREFTTERGGVYIPQNSAIVIHRDPLFTRLYYMGYSGDTTLFVSVWKYMKAG